MSNVNTTIVSTVRSSGFSLMPREIAQRSGLNPNTVRRAVRELVAAGTLVEHTTIGNSNTYKVAQPTV